MDESERRAAGMAIRRTVLGDAHVDRAVAATTPLTAEFQDLITRYAWGEVWTRPGLDLRSLSPWMPEITLSVNQDTSVKISFRLEDAEWHIFQNLPPVIADGLTDPTKEPRAIIRIKRAKDVLCKPDGVLVEGVLVGKITAVIKLASSGSGGTKLGWAKAGLNVNATRTSSTEISVKSNADSLALLYMVNPSREVVKDFELCPAP